MGIGGTFAGILVLIGVAAGPVGDGPLGPPARGEFLVLPLRVHLLRSETIPDVDCRLTEADVRRIIAKVNRVWHQAGIHWDLTTILREPADHQDEFRRAWEAPGEPDLGLLRLLVPAGSKIDDGMDVYYIQTFAINGVYLGKATAFVKATASLRTVDGGIDEPLPRVTAHELGHALGLPHRQERTNLLASGTTGFFLNAAEVDRARTFARRFKGMRPIAAVREAAEAAEKGGDPAGAARLWSTLAEIPGDGAAEARARRDALAPPVPAR